MTLTHLGASVQRTYGAYERLSSLSERKPDDLFYAWTTLPTMHGEFDVGVVKDGEKEHLAIVKGSGFLETIPLVRVHSECLTSEVLGSLKCDCRSQLEEALKRIQLEGQGIVIYLRQEGRGIGLGDKLRAYRLQEHGADTVDANRLLGLEDDLRTYEIAGKILRQLGARKVRLMTNNPLKVSGLIEEGIEVVQREEHVVGIRPENAGYLVTKRDRMGHLLAACDTQDSKVG
ncbi:MAG: GTP cyclohydrolase II [Myxococcota bacterium]|nr:GTP cyclohydrolase II [Myxococcota bacterium]